MSTTDLGAEKYVSFTSYRKDGTPKSLPVWIADLGDGTLGFTTASTSHKVKRVDRNPAVTLQPCDAKGNLTEGTVAVSGTAEAITGGAGFERVRDIVKAKYTWQYTGITTFGKLARLFGKGSGTDTAIVVTLDA